MESPRSAAIATAGACAAIEILERRAVRHNAVTAGADDALQRSVKTASGPITLNDFDGDVGATQQALALAEAVVLQALASGPAAAAPRLLRPEFAEAPSAECVGIAQVLDPGLRASLMRLVTEVAQPNVGLLEPDAVRARLRRLLVAHDRAALHSQLRAEELVLAAALYESAVAAAAAADTASCRAFAAAASGAPFERDAARRTELAAAAAASVSCCNDMLDRLMAILAPLPSVCSEISDAWVREAADNYVLLALPLQAALGEIASGSSVVEEGSESAFGLVLEPGSVPAATAAAAITVGGEGSGTIIDVGLPDPTAAAMRAVSAQVLLAAIEENVSAAVSLDQGGSATRTVAGPAHLVASAPSAERELAVFAVSHGLRYFHTGRRPGEVIVALPTDADDIFSPSVANADVVWSWAWSGRAPTHTPSTAAGVQPLNNAASSGLSVSARIPGLRVSAIATDSTSARAGLLRCHDVLLGAGHVHAAAGIWGVSRAALSGGEVMLQPFVVDMTTLSGSGAVEAVGDAYMAQQPRTSCDADGHHHPWVTGSFSSSVAPALQSSEECYIIVARPRLLVALEAILRGLTIRQALETPWLLRQYGPGETAPAVVASSANDSGSSGARAEPGEMLGRVLRDRRPFAAGNDTIVPPQFDEAVNLNGAAAVAGAAFAMGCEEGSFRDVIDPATKVARGYQPTGTLSVDPAIADALQHYPTASQQAARTAAVRAAAAALSSSTAAGSADHRPFGGSKAGRKRMAVSEVSLGADHAVQRFAIAASKPPLGAQRFLKKEKPAASPGGAIKGAQNRRSGLQVAAFVPDSDRLTFTSAQPAPESGATCSAQCRPVSREDILIAALRLECRYQRLTQGSNGAPGAPQVAPAGAKPSGLPGSAEVCDTGAPLATGTVLSSAPVVPMLSGESSCAPALNTGCDIGGKDASSSSRNAERGDGGVDVAVDARRTALSAAAFGTAASASGEASLALPVLHGVVSGAVPNPAAPEAAGATTVGDAGLVGPGMRVTFRMLTAAALRRVCEAVGTSPLGDKFILASRLRQLIRGTGDLFKRTLGMVDLDAPLADISPASAIPVISDGELVEQAPRVPLLSAAQSSSSILLAFLPPEDPAFEAGILRAYYRHPEVVLAVRNGPKRAAAIAATVAADAAGSTPNLRGQPDASVEVFGADVEASYVSGSGAATAAAASAAATARSEAAAAARGARNRKPSSRLVHASSDDFLLDEIAAGSGVKKSLPPDGRKPRKNSISKKPRLLVPLLMGSAASASAPPSAAPSATVVAAAPSSITVHASAAAPDPATSEGAGAAVATVQITPAILSASTVDSPGVALDTSSVPSSAALVTSSSIVTPSAAIVSVAQAVSASDFSASGTNTAAASPAVSSNVPFPPDQLSLQAAAAAPAPPAAASYAPAFSSTAPTPSAPAMPQPRIYKTHKVKTSLGKRAAAPPSTFAIQSVGTISEGAGDTGDLSSLSAAAAVAAAPLVAVAFAPSDVSSKTMQSLALIGSYRGTGRAKIHGPESSSSVTAYPDDAGITSDFIPAVWRYAAYAPSVSPGNPLLSSSELDLHDPAAPPLPSDAFDYSGASIHRAFHAKRRRIGVSLLPFPAGDAPASSVNSGIDFSLLSPTLPPILAPSPACELIARFCACAFIVHSPTETRAQRLLVNARVPDARPVVARAIADLAYSRGGGGDAFVISPLHRAIWSPPATATSLGASQVDAGAVVRTSALDSLPATVRLILSQLAAEMRRFPLQSREHATAVVRGAHALKVALQAALGDMRGDTEKRETDTGSPSPRSVDGSIFNAAVASVAVAGVSLARKGSSRRKEHIAGDGMVVEAGTGAQTSVVRSALTAEYVVGASTADPLTADVDPALLVPLEAPVNRRAEGVRLLRTLVQRVTAADLGRAAAVSAPLARYLSSTKPFFVQRSMTGYGSVVGGCVGAIEALRLCAAEVGASPAHRPLLIASPDHYRLDAVAAVVSAALGVPRVRSRPPLPLDAPIDPLPASVLTVTVQRSLRELSFNDSSLSGNDGPRAVAAAGVRLVAALATTEAARRRLGAVVVELGDRGCYLLAVTVASWLPTDTPVFEGRVVFAAADARGGAEASAPLPQATATATPADQSRQQVAAPGPESSSRRGRGRGGGGGTGSSSVRGSAVHGGRGRGSAGVVVGGVTSTEDAATSGGDGSAAPGETRADAGSASDDLALRPPPLSLPSTGAVDPERHSLPRFAALASTLRAVPLSSWALPARHLLLGGGEGAGGVTPSVLLASGKRLPLSPASDQHFAPDAMSLVLLPLQLYIVSGVLVTQLGQRLVHPAAVVQYVLAAGVARAPRVSRSAVAAPPAPVVAALKHWQPTWATTPAAPLNAVAATATAFSTAPVPVSSPLLALSAHMSAAAGPALEASLLPARCD